MSKDRPHSITISTITNTLTSDKDSSIAPGSRLVNVHLRLYRLRCRVTAPVFAVALCITFLLGFIPFEAQASGGSYTLKWYAADPSANGAPFLPTYEKLMPVSLPSPGTAGRYADPLTNAVTYSPISNNLDAVSSLAPKDMALGQIVPYEMVIKVGGSTAPENGTIRFTTSFDTNTTSGGNFGFDPAYLVYAAFVDTADAGTVDPENDARVDNFTSTLTGSGNSQQIRGTFNVSGLDNGDRVVVEIWVVLKPTISASSSGNVQTGLVSAETSSGSKINTGEQTVPLLRVKEFFTSEADISVVKTDSPDPMIQGQEITYSLIVKNYSPDTIANGVSVKDTLDLNTSFVSAIGASYTVNGNNITFNIGSLTPGQSKIITIVTRVSNTAPAVKDLSIDPEPGTPEIPALYDVINRVSATAITSDPKIENNVYYQPTNVLLALPVYFIDKKVIDVAGKGPTGDVTTAGDVIKYRINVSNVGNIDLTNVTLNDSLITLNGPTGDDDGAGILNVGETWTYTGNYTVTQADINSNGGGDELISNTATVDCDQLAPKSRTAEVPVKAMPAYTINKKILDIAGGGPAGEVTSAGKIINYQITVRNNGNVDLTNVTLNDSLINLPEPIESQHNDKILETSEVWTYTGNYTVTQADINSNGGGDGLIENTATVDCDQLAPKSQTAEVPLKADPAYLIDKVVLDVAGNGSAGEVTSAGNKIDYRINVSNVGNVDLTNVTLADSIISPINLTGPMESLSPDNILEPGEIWTYNGNYTVNQTDIDSNGGGDGLIENTATVDCDQLDSKSHIAEVPLKANPAYIIDKKVLDVAGNGPTGYVTASGDLIDYQINVSNVGSVSLTNVTLTDHLINFTGPVESLNPDNILEPGEVWKYNGNYTVTRADINSNGGGDGLIENTATVDCLQLDPKSQTVEVPLKADPAYVIDKVVTDVAGEGSSGKVTSAGNLISYQINVSNVGNVDLTNVTLTDPLINLTGPVESLNPDNILEPGEIWTYNGNYIVNQTDINGNSWVDGLIKNTATVDCDQLDPKSHTAEVPIQGSTAYIIDKRVTHIVGNGPAGYVIAAGDLISYQINVSNIGNTILTAVTLNDALINLTGPVESLNPDNILEPGEIWTYNGNYTVNQTDIDSNGGGDGLIENTATVDCLQLDPKSHTSEVPLKIDPAYVIDKVVTDVAGKGPAGYVTASGNLISYQINISNVGNVNLTNVTLNDSLISPINLTRPLESLNTNGILEPGEIWTYYGNYTVNQTDIDGNGGGDGLIENTATVDCDQLDPKSHTAEVPIQGSAAYIIDKKVTGVVGNGPAGYAIAAGDLISYQINVSNVGSTSLTNVTLTDPLISLTGPVESLHPDKILEPGEDWTYTGNYTVNQTDIDSNGGGDGSIENTATVDCDQLVPKSQTAEVAIKTPAYIINKEVINAAGKGPSGYVSSAGDIISYQVNVSNVGEVNLTNVILNDSLISQVNLTGPVESLHPDRILEPEETWTYGGNYTVTPADVNYSGTNNSDIDNLSAANSYIKNTATVDCDQLGPKIQTVEVRVKSRPAYIFDKKVIDVAGRGPSGYVTSVGDNIRYQLNVSNVGDINLTNVTLNSRLNLTAPFESLNTNGILEPGEIWVYYGNYTVTHADINYNGTAEGDEDDRYGPDGDIDSYATVDCDQLDPKTRNVEVQFGRPVYVIDKAVKDVGGTGPAGDVKKAGDIISYRVNVSNIGNLDLTNVTVEDPMIDLTGKTGDEDPAGILNMGETWEYEGNYTVTEDYINNTIEGQGLINNTATVNSTLLGPIKDSVTVPIVILPAYTINKIVVDVADQGPEGSIKAVGDVITYQINATNNGGVNLTNVTLSDSLFNLTGPKESLYADSILEPGESWIYNVTYTVTREDLNNLGVEDNDIDNIGGEDGDIDNIATIDCDQLAPKTHIVDVPIAQKPEISIFKSVISPDASGDCIINSPGDELPYRIVVKNEGNVDLTNVTVNDSRINLTGPIGNETEARVLHPGKIWTYTGVYKLKPGDINNGNRYINNTATVRCDELQEKSSNVSQPIDLNADLSIYKSVKGIDEVGDHIINRAGDIIQYQVAVKNNGDMDLTGVSVSDPKVNLTKATGDVNNPGVLDPKETWVYTGNYSVTQEDIDNTGTGAGTIENTATVSCNQLSDQSSRLELPVFHSRPLVVMPEPENSSVLPAADSTTNVTGGISVLSSDSSGDGDSTGKAVIIRNNASGSTDNTDTATVIPSSKNSTQSPAKSRTTGANAEYANQQAKTSPAKGSKQVPGFGIICGITALLSVFLYGRKLRVK